MKGMTKYDINERKEEDAARKVVRTTVMAELLNASTLPGLNPNQPTQRRSMASVNQPGLKLINTTELSFSPFFFSSLQI